MRSLTGYRRRSRVARGSRQLLSLLKVVALALATFLLLPMVVRADENDPFANFEQPGGSRTIHCEFTGQEALITETVHCRLRVANGGVLDGSFYLFVEEASYRVFRCPDQGRPGVGDDFDLETGGCLGGAARVEVERDDPRFDRFVSFWALSVTTRPIVTRSAPTERDVRYDSRFVESCAQRPLAEYDGGDVDADYGQMCDLGVIRGMQTTRNRAMSGEPTYERQYFPGMTLLDDGTDQTEFRGWELHFDMVIRAKVPADDTCPTTRLNGTCTSPVYTRR